MSNIGPRSGDEEMQMAVAESLSKIEKVRQHTHSIAPNGAGAGTELARLNDTIEQLYKTKRQQLQDMKARHLDERVQTINDYARRRDDLELQAAEAIRSLEDRHELEASPLTELILRVEGMR